MTRYNPFSLYWTKLDLSWLAEQNLMAFVQKNTDLFFSVQHGRYLSHLNFGKKKKKGKLLLRHSSQISPEGSDKFANRTTRFVTTFGTGAKQEAATDSFLPAFVASLASDGRRVNFNPAIVMFTALKWQDEEEKLRPSAWCWEKFITCFSTLTSSRYSSVHLLPFYFTGNDR